MTNEPKIIGPYVHSGPLGNPGWKVARMHPMPGGYEFIRNATNRDMRELPNYDTGRPVLEGHGYHGENPDAPFDTQGVTYGVGWPD